MNKTLKSESIKIEIFIAGDLARAKQTCREFCFARGLCVTIEPTTYIYTGGEEEGIRIGLINYPRFPSTYDELLETARKLAYNLMIDLCQTSYSIFTPTETLWFSRRKD